MRNISAKGNDQYEVYEEATNKGNFPDQPKRHECDRVCKQGEPPKICRYIFEIAAHTTMGKVSIMTYSTLINKFVMGKHSYISVDTILPLFRRVICAPERTRIPLKTALNHTALPQMGLKKE